LYGCVFILLLLCHVVSEKVGFFCYSIVTEDIVTELDNKNYNCLEVTLVKYTIIGLQGSYGQGSEEF